MEKENKKRSKHLRVPVNAEEELQIVKRAAAANMSIASYLRSLGLGYEPTSVLDFEKVKELARYNADQSRLGNLLKLALTEREKMNLYSELDTVKKIDELVKKLSVTQDHLLAVVKQLL